MIAVYLFLLVLLGVYSYSQIDLNLTLFQTPSFLNFQSLMTNLGYYNRPISALLFLLLVISLFGLYGFLLKNCAKLTKKHIVISAVVISVVALLSYPAFSYDFFNYLFDARIITKYGQNPYFFKALDFPTDPWIRFMHWVHRTYPYGPGWLLLTVPASLLGLGKLVPTMLVFKGLFLGNYALGLFIINKIYQRINPEKAKWAMVFYGLNPLVIVEGLISPHLDAMMATLLLAGFYFFVAKKTWWSLGAILLSGSTKFLTWILFPIFAIKTITLEKLAIWSLILMSLILIPVIAQREFYPWYFLPHLAIVTLLPNKRLLHYAVIILSLALVLQYGSFLYVGEYIYFESEIKTILFVGPLLLGTLFYRSFAKRLTNKV